MVTTSLLLLALVFASAPVDEQAPTPPPLAPGGMAPLVGAVDGVRDGNLIFQEQMMVPVAKTVTVQVPETVEVDGKLETRTVTRETTVTQMVARVNLITVPLAKVKAFDLDGRAISTAKLSALFPRPSLVLYSYHGITVDPAFLKVARPGVIFVMMPIRDAVPPVPPPDPLAPPAPVPVAPESPPPVAPPQS